MNITPSKYVCQHKMKAVLMSPLFIFLNSTENILQIIV